MRSYVIFGLLIVFLILWGVHIVLRPLPSRVIVSSLPPDLAATAPRSLVGRRGSDSSTSVRTKGQAADRPLSEAKKRGEQTTESSRGLDRPLKVTGLGWPVVAAGVWANGGLTPGEESAFSTDLGLEVHISVAENPLDIERALAEGGDDPEGADIAILPLQTLVALYSDLEPLHPEVFLTTGWSRGQHVVMARQIPEGTLSLTGGSLQENSFPYVAPSGSPEHFLALLTLDLVGIGRDRATLVGPEDEGAPEAALVAMSLPPRGVARAGLEVILSTDDATRAVPIVAVSSRWFIEEHRDALASFSLTWIRASEALISRVPEVARQLGAIEGAPEALDLLGPLVRYRPVDLVENARLVGLAGQDMVTLERIFTLTSELYADSGVTGPATSGASAISQETVAAVVRAGLVQDSRRMQRVSPAWGELPPWSTSEAQIFMPLEDLGDSREAQVERLGLVAGLFASSRIRARPRGMEGAQLEEILNETVERYDIDPERISPSEVGPISGFEIVGRGD